MHFQDALRRRQAVPPSPTTTNVISVVGPSTLSTTSKVVSATNPPRSSSLNLSISPSSVTTSTTQSSSSALPATSTGKDSGPKAAVIIPVIAAIVAIVALGLFYLCLRRTRRKHKNPKYIPSGFLKKLWEKWDPEPVHYRLPDTNEHLEPQRGTGLNASSGPANFDAATANAVQAAVQRGNSTTSGGVDRNTSVRSVMTLPAYNPSARENEQVLGREGERGGIDVVIEFPEGADEEEERREAEMEALYQVRLARRRENEEREERRRLRREARERGDYVALRELQARARAGSAASGGRTVEELRAEHDRMKKERQRAVSSVSYADLGVARHDGTRLRANSNDSEREGLLGEAAGMGLLGDSASIGASSYHRRDRSAGSIVSIDTMNSDLPSPGLTRSRGNSRAERPESPLRRVESSTSEVEGRAGSSPEMIEHDDVPPNSPPGYENISLADSRPENPPQYSSPVVGRGEHSSMFDSPRFSVASERRPSLTHIGQLMAERRTSSGSIPTPSLSPTAERRSSRGVGNTPQLPSLRLTSLPSIHVEAPPAAHHDPEP